MRVLLRRHGDGIGDWLLMLQAMKNVNVQRPDIELSVDFELTPIGRRPRTLSPLVRRAFAISDVTWKPLAVGDVFDATIPHVIYERLGYEDYAAGMLRNIGDFVDHVFDFDPDLVPIYTPIVYRSDIVRRFAVLASQSKAETNYKNWGLDRFELLAQQLARRTDCELVQLGAAGDYLLQGATYHRMLGQPLDAVIGALNGAHVIVCLENFVAVLAAQLRRPVICLYSSVGSTRSGDPRALGRLGGPTFHRLVTPSIDAVANLAEGFFR